MRCRRLGWAGNSPCWARFCSAWPFCCAATSRSPPSRRRAKSCACRTTPRSRACGSRRQAFDCATPTTRKRTSARCGALDPWAQKKGHRPHRSAKYRGPWVENVWITHFERELRRRPPGSPLSSVFGPFIPLLVPWTDRFVSREARRRGGARARQTPESSPRSRLSRGWSARGAANFVHPPKLFQGAAARAAARRAVHHREPERRGHDGQVRAAHAGHSERARAERGRLRPVPIPLFIRPEPENHATPVAQRPCLPRLVRTARARAGRTARVRALRAAGRAQVRRQHDARARAARARARHVVLREAEHRLRGARLRQGDRVEGGDGGVAREPRAARLRPHRTI